MSEITFQAERDEDSGWLVASWDAPEGGGISTQGEDLWELQEQVTDAVACHFEGESAPHRIRLHFISDPLLLPA
ncbi:MAG: 2-oxoisovalerate dehydrogenase [Acidobacteria bacterium]|nr:2-oxoisovalerate dehydrogenase [Acidobacteriota bacterium]